MDSEKSSAYLETGKGDAPGGGRLDLIRAKLAQDETWADPPGSVLDGVLLSIELETSGSKVGPARVWWRRPLAVAGVLVAALAVVLLSLAGFLSRADETVVAMSGTHIDPHASGTATLKSTGGGWVIHLDVNGLPPAAPGTYYEGWVWSDGGEGVSIGTFHLRGGDQPVTLWSGVDLSEYPSIWVTLQNEGAGPEPSDQVVMRGRWDLASG
jgi:Anti-sigma-K factor rskA, C-terminal